MSARLAVVRCCNECPHAGQHVVSTHDSFRSVLHCTAVRPQMDVPRTRIPDTCPLPKARKCKKELRELLGERLRAELANARAAYDSVTAALEGGCENPLPVALRERDEALRERDGGVHSCHAACSRPACVLRRERDEARALLRTLFPQDYREAICNYASSDWSKARDPSRLGALNAVAYIGERAAALYVSCGARVAALLGREGT